MVNFGQGRIPDSLKGAIHLKGAPYFLTATARSLNVIYRCFYIYDI